MARYLSAGFKEGLDGINTVALKTFEIFQALMVAESLAPLHQSSTFHLQVREDEFHIAEAMR